MPLFMDRHHFSDSATWEKINQVHEILFALQNQFGVKMLICCFNEPRYAGFCLSKTDDKEDLVCLHEQAHDSIPNEVIDVQPGLV